MPLSDLPQSNKQHAVPQNIMSVEFKLIGDLTMRQFAYLMVFGLTAYLAAVSIVGIFKWPAVVVLILSGVGFAFVPFAERGLDEWIVNFIRAIYSPTQEVWRKEPTVPEAFLYENLSVVKQELITLAPASSRRKLEEYLKYQDNTAKRDPLDIPEEEYVLKVRQAFKDTVQSASVSTATYAPPIAPTVTPDVPAQIPMQPPQEVNPPEQLPEEPEKAEEPTVSTIPPVPTTDTPQPIVAQPVAPQPQPQSKPVVQVPQKPKAEPRAEIQFPREGYSADITLSPITPDMHSGRRFTNLVPTQGELVLPIRGERVLKTSDDVELEKELLEKAEKLQKLLGEIKEKESPATVAPVSSPASTNPTSTPATSESKDNELNEKIKQLKEEISQQPQGSQQSLEKEQKLKELQEQKEKMASSYSDLEKKLQDLRAQLEDKEKTAFASALSAQSSMKPKAPSLTDKPNIISGFIYGPNKKVLENVLLLIKNRRNEPVRALKTNQLGQFILSTPLENGVYTIEISPNNETGLTFDIIPIELKGEIVPSVEMVGK